MGNYVSAEDVKERLAYTAAVLYDKDGTLDETAVEADIADVEAYVNALLRQRYSVPVQAPEALALLRGVVLELFAELAYRRLPSSETPLSVERAAERSRALLRDFARGRLLLPATAAQGPAGVLVESGPARMRRGNLEGF